MGRLKNEYRELWLAAGYGDKCGSAAVVKPPPSEFRRVYHLTNANHAISNIGLGRIKIARLKDLNDPFEALSANFRDRAVREVVRKFKNDFNEYAGLLSFSRDWINPVLWSHYGDRHKGICLGFDVRRDCARCVDYQSERLYLSIDGNLSNDPSAGNLRDILLYTKFKHWEYESEVRSYVELKYAMQEGGLYFQPLGDEIKLREVILGVDCPLSVEAVRALTKSTYTDAEIFRARLADKWFSVVPDENTLLD